LQQHLGGSTAGGFVDHSHRARLDDLVTAQADELLQLHNVLDRIDALLALGRWSRGWTTASRDEDATVLVSDLQLALQRTSAPLLRAVSGGDGFRENTAELWEPGAEGHLPDASGSATA
jgi:hypothetical protein